MFLVSHIISVPELYSENIKNIEKIQRSMTRYVFNYAEVDYEDRLLIFTLSMHREYINIIFWKCIYGSYDVDVNYYYYYFFL